MKLKTLLLGTAGALAVVGGAQAADLSVAEPVEYVKVCDAFGVGSRIPAHRDLMARFETTERTVLGALAELQRRGRIVRRAGSGTYVATPASVPSAPAPIANLRSASTNKVASVMVVSAIGSATMSASSQSSKQIVATRYFTVSGAGEIWNSPFSIGCTPTQIAGSNSKCVPLPSR